MFKISGRQEFNKGRHINEILRFFFPSGIDDLYCVYVSYSFTIPAASTPGSGGQVRVTVSQQANRHNDDEAVCLSTSVCVCCACACECNACCNVC